MTNRNDGTHNSNRPGPRGGGPGTHVGGGLRAERAGAAVLAATKRFDGLVTVTADRTTTGSDLTFPVVAFGTGERPLVILPGLSDGLTTVEGKSLMLSWYYRKLPDHYRTIMISRPIELPDVYSTQHMAADYAALLRALGGGPAPAAARPAGGATGHGAAVESGGAAGEHRVDLWGISQGGMISQWLAAEHGELVRRLCLAVTTPHATPTLREVVAGWEALANADRYGELMRDTMRKTYTPRYLRRYALMMPFMGLMGKPKSFRRFLIQADACLTHDAMPALARIAAPTLVIGGDADRVVGPGTSEALAAQIPGAELKVYPQLGHGAFEEAPDATERVMGFFAGGGG